MDGRGLAFLELPPDAVAKISLADQQKFDVA